MSLRAVFPTKTQRRRPRDADGGVFVVRSAEGEPAAYGADSQEELDKLLADGTKDAEQLIERLTRARSDT